MNSDTRVEDCDLCEAARFTHWYLEDETCWVADCEVCSVPMVAWRHHGTEPSDADRAHMVEQLRRAGHDRFGDVAFEIDQVMRQIPDHWHAHARDADWFAMRGQRAMSRFTAVGGVRVERT